VVSRIGSRRSSLPFALTVNLIERGHERGRLSTVRRHRFELLLTAGGECVQLRLRQASFHSVEPPETK